MPHSIIKQMCVANASMEYNRVAKFYWTKAWHILDGKQLLLSFFNCGPLERLWLQFMRFDAKLFKTGLGT